jgi:predicted AlkP superfamily phosphohydrolase/phosphomutase
MRPTRPPGTSTHGPGSVPASGDKRGGAPPANTSSPRLFLLGIDGLPPNAFDRFMSEGLLPNCRRLAAASGRLEVIPTLPPLTAPGWATIASGANPATHGLFNILQPQPGCSPDSICNGFDRRLVNAEYLWDALSDEGRPAIVVKYPSSWPPRDGGFCQIDGAGGYADITCQFELLPSTAYFCSPQRPEGSAAETALALPKGYSDHWRIDSGAGQAATWVVPRAPLGWGDLPQSARALFEATLTAQPRGQRHRDHLHALIFEQDGVQRLCLSRKKSAAEAVATLREGEWSGWIHENTGEDAFAYRVKLISLDAAARCFWLYRSESHSVSGFTRPPELAAELLDAVGPVCEWTGTFDTMNGLADLATQLEIYDRHTAWLEDTIRHMSRKPWHGFFTQWHVVEYAHHIAGSALSDDHPLSGKNKVEYLDFLRGAYRLMDRLVGTVLDCVDAQDTLALVSDHGHEVVHSLFFANNFLRENGWLATRMTAAGGQEIDWTRSTAYATYPGCILINSNDRWSGGIVPPEDVEPLCDSIGEGLEALVDPRTRRPFVTALIRRDEMADFGQAGAGGPDLYFTLCAGYETASRLGAESAALLELTVPGTEATSGHGSFHPHSAEAGTLAFIRNSTLRAGSVARAPSSIIDLAPTLAHLIGLRPLRQADGQPLDFERLGVAAER